MASGPPPPPPSISVLPSPSLCANSSATSAFQSSQTSQASQKPQKEPPFPPTPTAPVPPAILLEPTPDNAAEADDPFRFEVDADDAHPSRNPHEALFRRSPSPVLDFPPPRTARPRRLSPSTLLNPDNQPSLNRRGSPLSSPVSNNFLRPPPSPGSFSSIMDDLSSSTVNSAPIPIQGTAAADSDNPFNFQTQYISTSPVKSNIGLRRGHRYKHSSVSAQHQIFQEPPQRPPPVLPASLPVPTVREAWHSMYHDQRMRLYWCLCHAAVAIYVFYCAAEGGDSLALTALSHLVFFDVGSAAVCVAVDVLGNFEVWRRSTIRHPFGLRRAEVLAGFAMSIFLVFGGFDLLSHDLKDCLEAATAPLAMPPSLDGAVGMAHAHHAHVHGADLDVSGHHHRTRYIHPGTVDLPALAAFACTLVSAYGLGNHARIRRALLLLHGVAPYSRISKGGGGGVVVSKFAAAMSSAAALLSRVGLSSMLANPFHFLTLGVSLVLLVLPLMFVAVQTWLDRLLCATIAVSMLMLGARLAVAQGLMLLMSYSGKEATDTAAAVVASDKDNSVASVLDEIAAEPQVARVEDAQFWQVHYGLCMANLCVRVAQGCDDDTTLRQLRSRIARVVQNRLGEGYGRGNSLRWEVTVQTSVDG